MVDQTLDARFAAWLEQNRQRILDDWMALARIPSVQSEAAPDAPFGIPCAQALSKAAELFAGRGMDVRLNKACGYALASCGNGEKTIGLFGHSDVVPAGDGWEFTQPFEPVIQNGMLIGRGVYDNKSGVMASLCVMEMLKELNIPLKARLQAFVGSNEESGMSDIGAFVKNEAMPDLSLVPDAAFPCGLGEKGILRMWARCGQVLTAVREFKGGNAFNIVLDHVDAVVDYSKALAAELEGKCTGAPYTLRVTDEAIYLSADGVAKHAASPDGSVSAVYLLAKLLASCETLPESDRVIFGTVESFLSSHWGEGMGIAHEDSHFGKLSAVCGMVKVEDGHLMVSIDSRYGTEVDPAALERQLYTCWGEAGWEISYMENRAGYLVAESSPVPGMLTDIFRTMSGHDRSCYYMSGGTYGRYLKNAFVVGTNTVHADREGPGMVMPAGHGGAHQRDEAIDIEAFFLDVRILAQFVLACDQFLSE